MKIGLVTGASGAIGRAIALDLAEEGFSLYLHYNKNEQALQDLIMELEARFPMQFFKSRQADFLNKEAICAFIDALPKNEIELIVHNSGHSEWALFQDIKEEALDQMLLHHVKVPFLLTQALIPHMIRQKYGRIIFISSIWGLTGAATEVSYSMVKGAQNSLCKALAKELGPSGITVNSIAPGAVESSMLNMFSESELADLTDEIPMGRLGKPFEVASLVRYLTQPEASYLTGQVVSVNGGWYC